MNVPDDIAFKLGEWVWGAVLAFCGLMWKLINGRVDKVELEIKTHIDEVRKEHRQMIDSLDTEVTRQRDVSAKIFDKLESMSKESADRHERLLTALHIGLAGKVDK